MTVIFNFFYIEVFMKSIHKLFIVIAIMGSISTTAYSADKDITVGLGYGLNQFTYTDYFDVDYKYAGRLGSIFALYTNGIGSGFTPEISFTTHINETYNAGVFYNTYALDAKVRYYPFNQKKLAPYAFVGLGYYIWDEHFADARNVYIPVGVGATHFFTQRIGVDLNVGYNIADPNLLFGKFSVLYRVVNFAKDTDADGLSDDDEVKYGTNPNKPDTDNDGLLDGKEVHRYRTDPKNRDTDDGGISDGAEVSHKTNPLDPDDDILCISVGEKILVRNMLFETGKSTLSPTSERTLGFTLKAMQSSENIELQIVGNTDDVGTQEFNQQLSQDRADAVKKWLVSRGVESGRLTTRGAGFNEPLVSNTSDENRQRNRRVEIYRTK
jgi:outer membrane protein OmpA-like peptidoglycan-associated protein